MTWRDIIIAYLPWLLSALTVYMTLLAGNKHPSAWAVGLVNQALWLGWIVTVGAWGLLPMNAALWVVYARNHFKWRMPNDVIPKSEKAPEGEPRGLRIPTA